MNKYQYTYNINNVEHGVQSTYAESFYKAVTKVILYLDYYAHGQSYEILEISLIESDIVVE